MVKKLLHKKRDVILGQGQDQQQHPAVHTRGVIRARGGSVAEDILKVDFFCVFKTLVMKYCARKSAKTTLKITYYVQIMKKKL